MDQSNLDANLAAAADPKAALPLMTATITPLGDMTQPKMRETGARLMILIRIPKCYEWPTKANHIDGRRLAGIGTRIRIEIGPKSPCPFATN